MLGGVALRVVVTKRASTEPVARVRPSSATEPQARVVARSDRVSTCECQTAPRLVHLHQRRAGEPVLGGPTAPKGENKSIVLCRRGHARAVARSVPEAGKCLKEN